MPAFNHFTQDMGQLVFAVRVFALETPGEVGLHDPAMLFDRIIKHFREFDFRRTLTQVCYQLGKGLLGVRLRLVPHRCFNKRQPRLNRKVLSSRFHETGPGPQADVGITNIIGHHLLGDQRDIHDSAREHSDMVKGSRLLKHTVSRDTAIRWLVPVDTAKRSRPDNRTAGLGANRQGHHAGCHRGGRTAG